MQGETLKFVNVQQTKPYNIYKNTKLKLMKTNVAIWFNKICRDRQWCLSIIGNNLVCVLNVETKICFQNHKALNGFRSFGRGTTSVCTKCHYSLQ